MNSLFEETSWEVNTFEYSLNNGDTYSLRYFAKDSEDGRQVVVACKDLYESIGQDQRHFTRDFSLHQFGVMDLAKQIGGNNRTRFTTLRDALRYVNDKNKTFRQTFIERGMDAVVSAVTGDVVGVLTNLGMSQEDAEEAVISTATNNQLSARTKSRLKRNEFTKAISEHGGHGWIYSSSTDKGYVATLGKTTKQLRAEYGVKGTPRDVLSPSDLNKVMQFEISATNNIDASGANGNIQIDRVIDYTADCYTAMLEGAKNLFK